VSLPIIECFIDPGLPALASFPEHTRGTTSATGSGSYARAIGLQVLIALAMAVVWGALGNPTAGVSALVGGAICFIPSTLFAWRLKRAAARGVAAFGGVFLVGEVVKLGLSVVLFALVLRMYPEVDHAALVITFIVTLQAYLFALLIA
jgi:ATP synthase protein I